MIECIKSPSVPVENVEYISFSVLDEDSAENYQK